jgi:hypothetical protein
MALFTFVLEYAGGTYISQYRGRTPREALRRWCKGEEQEMTGQWAPATVDELFTNISCESPTPLDGAMNAWCVSTLAANKLALLNIVKTHANPGDGTGA